MDYQKDIEASLMGLEPKMPATNESLSLSEAVRLAKDWLPETEKHILSRGDEPELPLKRLKALNDMIWGIHKGKMTVIAGRTSQAKSVVATNIAWDLACQGKKVFFISLEMSVHQILERIFCLEYNVNNYELLTGKMQHNDYLRKSWARFKADIDGLPIIMTDMIGRTWQEVDDVITALGKKPDIVIIDHIQEISSKGLKKLDAIEEYLNHMRALAVKNHFALVLCSQINRLGQSEKDRRPELHQLKGSGAIEEKSDIVMLLHWQYHYDQTADRNLLELNIAKNRCGRTGKIGIKFIPEYSRLENMDVIQETLHGKHRKPDLTDRMLGDRGETNNLRPMGVQRADSKNNQEEIVWEE